MELLLAGLAGLGGLALLLQSKALPSKADAEKAFEALDKNPTDPDANTVFGKYKAFVQGDYNAAMPYLVHSKDATLKTLAEHELDEKHTATHLQKVGMGDEWVVAAKKFPALNKIFYDRASYWYAAAWPSLDGLWLQKVQQQLQKLHQNMAVPDPKGASVPGGWKLIDPNQKSGATPKAARTGRMAYQAVAGKIPPAEYSMLEQQIPVVAGKTYDLSAFALTDGTDAIDYVSFVTFGQGGAMNGIKVLYLPRNEPWWHYVKTSFVAPADSNNLVIHLGVKSTKGNIFVDDISVKDGEKELVKNGSFEDK